jgi:soluble lytic murein transglycosylase
MPRNLATQSVATQAITLPRVVGPGVIWPGVIWPGVIWQSLAAVLLAGLPLLAAPPVPSPAQQGDLAALARAWRESPTPAHHAALEAYAATHAAEITGAQARLALGVAAYEQKDYAASLEYLEGLSVRLPQIADYIAYYEGAARVEAARDLDKVAPELEPVRRSAVPSPLAGRAWLLRARALKPTQPAEAVRLLREHYAELPQPEGDINLADCYQAAGDLSQAADFYQRVYYQYISGDALARATAALLTLKDSLGAAYPQPLPQQLLRRADLLFQAREYAGARREYETLTGQLVGQERDQARVRLGAADLLGGNAASACPYLSGLELDRSEADAERLFYLEECARRLNTEDEMMSALDRLDQLYPHSPWRLRALAGVANRYLVTHRMAELAPLDEAIYEGFPNEPQAAQAHWRTAFQAYLEDQHGAPALLREHLEKFPAHPTAEAALYFLGRGAEREKDSSAAAAFYNRLSKVFPNTYYAMLARERANGPQLQTAAPSAAAEEFLDSLSLPQPKPLPLEATAATTARIERSRLLRNAGLPDLADAELRFGARTDSQPALVSMEMAASADAPYQGLRAMKSLNSNYLNLPLAAAPEKFWKLLFPMPYRQELVASARAMDLDPYLVAGLIRQESEFNPEAVSRANAYGLTQVRPVTGRQYARQAGVLRFTSRLLFEPSANLKIGATIFRAMLDKNNGSLEQTLAAYNAGPARAAQWTAWSAYREPAEFVEAIPFTETRDYVESVLRNADIYKRLYR